LPVTRFKQEKLWARAWRQQPKISEDF